MPPTFSVVIPTYNQADFLSLAVQSVLEQTFSDFEIIVVNNNSTDHTLQVLEHIKDKRLNVINYQNNGVIGAARNVGIKSSTSSWVAFLDSDDTWENNKLERIAAEIDADPQVGVLCHNQVTNRDGSETKQPHCGPPRSFKGDLHNYLLTIGNCLATSATVVSKSKLAAAGGFSEDRELITVEDYDLWLRLSTVCRFRFVNEFLGTQFYHPNSASTNVERHLQNTLTVLNRHFDADVDSHGLKLKMSTLRRYAHAYYHAGRWYQRQESFASTLKCYFKGLTTYPLHLRTYAALGLLFFDRIFGHARRVKIIRALRPGSWPTTWMIP